MRSRYKIINDDCPHFITCSVIEWLPVFTKKEYFDIIIHALQFSQKQKDLKIHAYVVLDNHLHLIISGNNLAKAVKEFKSFTAKEIINTLEKNKVTWLLNQFAFFKKKYKVESNYQVWQEGFHPKMIKDESMLQQKIEYIHYNPVKRGLVKESDHWLYSSANNYIHGTGILDIEILQ